MYSTIDERNSYTPKFFKHLEFLESVELNIKYFISQNKIHLFFALIEDSQTVNFTMQLVIVTYFKPSIKNVCPHKLRESGRSEIETQPTPRTAHWGHTTCFPRTTFPLHWSQVQNSDKMRPHFLKIPLLSVSITDTNLRHSSCHHLSSFYSLSPM